MVLLGCGAGSSHRLTADPLERIPATWIDLPEAPFVARRVRGLAVLVNRSNRVFDRLTLGCVVQREGKVRTVGELFAMEVSDGLFGPGREVEGFLRMVNNIDWYVANQPRIVGGDDVIRPCPANAKTALVTASLGPGRTAPAHSWSAEGTDWARD
jgi:hypothetical protein